MAVNRLLILDDDLRVLNLLAEIGRGHGYEMTLTASVDDFLDAYDATLPSLVILDLQFRESDGIAVMSLLTARRCTAPIVLISGFDERVLETARRVGEASNLRIVGALTKPIRLGAIRPILEVHREPDSDEWATDIRLGLDAGQFAVHYQPKVAAGDGRVLGFEALAR